MTRRNSFWLWMLAIDVVFAPALILIYGTWTWATDVRQSWRYWQGRT